MFPQGARAARPARCVMADLETPVGLTDTHASRRYFRKFEAITGHLAPVAAVLDGGVSIAVVKSDVKSEATAPLW